MVRATDAIRLCREGGFVAVPPERAGRFFDNRLDMVEVRRFLSRNGLPRFALSEFDDRAVRGNFVATSRRAIWSCFAKPANPPGAKTTRPEGSAGWCATSNPDFVVASVLRATSTGWWPTSI